MPSSKKILIFGGRYATENPYRELLVKKKLEEKGFSTLFAIPGYRLNKAGYHEKQRNEAPFQRENVVLLDSEQDFYTAVRQCDAVLFSTWRSYLPLTQIARSLGRPTANFCATNGIDYWSHGVDCCLIRSPYTHRMLIHEYENSGHTLPPENRIALVGSVQYEYLESVAAHLVPTKEAFYRRYNLDLSRPLAILFPKGIQSFRDKIPKWFKHWDAHQADVYNQRFLTSYETICQQVKQARFNLLIKMHPSAYAGYLCDAAKEYAYWQQYPWAKVLDPEDTLAMLHHADVGLGITSFSALDLAYFGKPFIYVDSGRIEPPDTLSFATINQISRIPPGPSSHWHTNPSQFINPWFPGWVGSYCQSEQLAQVLNDPASLTVRTEDLATFIEEFWYKNDGLASERIADEFIARCLEPQHSWQLPRRLYRSYRELSYRLRTLMGRR
ncbi:MAG: hypothetical protein HQL78_03850 [Magnetococcales bacterium]|nr:hypothetical protein [Magnetococcales bacterium]